MMGRAEFVWVFRVIVDVCAESLLGTCRELAGNLPSLTMPVSIATLLRLRDVGPRSSGGGGAAVVPPRGVPIK